jgi:hypothetical protein
MNRFVTILLLVCPVLCFAQAPQLKSGAAVFIEPVSGYETYLAAAIVKEHVPLTVVADRDKAAYIIRSTVTQPDSSQPAVVVNNGSGSGRGGYGALLNLPTASIAVIEEQSSNIVFAYSAGRGGLQRSAEDCAKHLKEFIEKKPKK